MNFETRSKQEKKRGAQKVNISQIFLPFFSRATKQAHDAFNLSRVDWLAYGTGLSSSESNGTGKLEWRFHVRQAHSFEHGQIRSFSRESRGRSRHGQTLNDCLWWLWLEFFHIKVHMCIAMRKRAHLPHLKLTLHEEIYNKMTQTYVALIWPSSSAQDPDNCQLTDDNKNAKN